MLLGQECHLKFKKNSPVIFEVLRPKENVKPAAGQNLGTTKIPLPLRTGDKKGVIDLHYYATTLILSFCELWGSCAQVVAISKSILCLQEI